MNVHASDMRRGAVLSGCGAFRYRLTRAWVAQPQRVLCFVMLNPSTADAEADDPTIVKCIGFAQRLGFDGIDVVNLFAYRATAPRDLRKAGYPVGPENDAWIRAAANDADVVVCAWGSNARGLSRPDAVLELLREEDRKPMVLGRCNDGTPAHPLFQPYSRQLEVL